MDRHRLVHRLNTFFAIEEEETDAFTLKDYIKILGYALFAALFLVTAYYLLARYKV